MQRDENDPQLAWTFGWTLKFPFKVFDQHGLNSLQDIESSLSVKAHPSFWWMACLITAVTAHELFHTERSPRGGVATLYQYIMEASHKTLPLDRVWRRDFPEPTAGFGLEQGVGYFLIGSSESWPPTSSSQFCSQDLLDPTEAVSHESYRWCMLSYGFTTGTLFSMMWECGSQNGFLLLYNLVSFFMP